MVKRVRGDVLAIALENAACDIFDGRFVQVSGLAFSVDPRRPVGTRVRDVHMDDRSPEVAPGHAPPSSFPSCGADSAPGPGLGPVPMPMPARVSVPIRADAHYTVAMTAFIAAGCDGYACFQDAPTVVDVEGAMTDSALLVRVFRGDGDLMWRGACGDAIGPKASEASKASEGSGKPEGLEGPVERARAAVVVGWTPTGLPVVRPTVQGRIRYVGQRAS